ncbi:MAG: metallophosphoesterase [Acidobacteria bacterium]|jgi:hypothetical protein|nr:metallophosphoesterase [Acidobacteriota bacterium]
MQRRDFLKMAAAAVPAGLVTSSTAVYAVAVEPTWIQVWRHRLAIPRWPAGLSGLSVVQLSDIHRSDIVSGAFVREAVETVLGLRPELIVLTGDFISGDTDCFRLVAEELAPLAQVAPVFASMGNHDYDHWYRPVAPRLPHGDQLLGDQFARVGIELLVDRGRAVALRDGAGEIEVLGLDDFWRKRFDPAAAFRSLPGNDDAGRPRLVLGHNPDAYAAIQDQRFELALFGHTHGGQISLPLLGVPYVPCEDPRFTAGLVDTGRHLVYTNRGLGYNRRVRFGVRPEITHFTLVPA